MMINQFFFLNILCIILSQIISQISFIYPHSTILSDGNILIIHKYGITICNQNNTQIIRNIIVFIGDEILEEESLSRITLKSEFGYILSIINDKIYIFDETGVLLKGKITFLDENENPGYYTLVPMKIDNNFYEYVIGFVNNNLLYFYYYQFNIADFDNTLIYYVKEMKHIYDILQSIKEYYYIENNALSCEYMLHDTKGEFLVCFFIILISSNYHMTIEHFEVKNEKIEISQTIESYHFIIENSLIIKSGINKDHTKSLICFHIFDGYSKCIIYHININYLSADFKYYSYEHIKCRNKYYGYKVDYYIDKKEEDYFIFSCINENGTIMSAFFDGILGDECGYDEDFKYNDCESIYGYTILYIKNLNDYYVLSDVTCNNIDHPFEILNPTDEETDLETKEVEIIDTTQNSENENIKSSEITQITENIDNYETDENKKTENIESSEIIQNSENIESSENIENIDDYENVQTKCKNLEKCELYDKDSLSKCLCITCNENKRYFLLNNLLSKPKKDEIYGKYIDCVNDITKPINFYYNIDNNDYEECYETCNTCNFGGDKNENNCTSCESNYIKEPDLINSTNCVLKCPYLYYYTSYGKYKCTSLPNCPDEYNLYIKDKKKCIDNCEKEEIFKYHYNGECLKECPIDTINDNFFCKDNNINKCLLSENEYIYIDENINDSDIEKFAKKYTKEFYYTNNHVSVFKNNIYTITIYKNRECISSLTLENPEVDFSQCDEKLKNHYNIDNNLVIVIIMKKLKEINYKKMISFSMFEPKDGKKLPVNEICENEPLYVQENLIDKLNNSDYDIKSLLYLANQNINIFNISSEFYNDICYNFDSMIDKDITLKDRILLYYPNITLCESGCHIRGVNLTTLRAKCECKLNNIINNIFENNLLFESQFGEIKEIINQINIEIVKCYKNIFSKKNISSCIGGFIIIGLIITQVISSIFYCKKSIFLIKKYIFGITSKYILYLSSQNNIPYDFNFSNEPPKKKKIKRKFKKKEIRDTEPFIMRQKMLIEYKLNENSYNTNNLENFPKINSRNEIISKNSNRVFLETYPKNNNIQLYSSINQTQSNLSTKKYKKRGKSKFNKKNLEETTMKSNFNLKMNNISNPTDKNTEIMNHVDISNINLNDYLKTEIDSLEYDDIIRRDQRTFFQYFNSKLNKNQILLRTFFTDDPIKPRTIKIILFILDIDLYLFVNALFFNEDYISEVFHSNKEEKFFTFIPRSFDRFFYTTLVGVIISYIIDCFFVEEKKIKGVFKREKDNITVLKSEITNISETIKRRNIYFIILSFLITVFTLYYILCFNSIFPHMRDEWIKSSIIIIIIMQILSLLECLLETIIRFISFKCKSEKIYKLSLLLS